MTEVRVIRIGWRGRLGRFDERGPGAPRGVPVLVVDIVARGRRHGKEPVSRRRPIEPESRGRPHPLLVDWLDSELGACGDVARVLVVGTRADADLFTGAAHVSHATSPDLVSTQDTFDLVVAVDCLRLQGIGAQLDRVAGAVGEGGRLLIIAATEADRPGVVSAAELAPLRVAGLRPVAFDDLAADARGDPEPGRWLRALYQRDGARRHT